MRSLRALAVLFCAVLVPAPAHADVIYSNLGPGNSYDPYYGFALTAPNNVYGWPTVNSLGFQFQVTGSYSLNQIIAPLFTDEPSTPSASFDLSVQRDNGGLPGSVIETLHFDGSLPAGSIQNQQTLTLSSVSHPTIGPGTYWLMASPLSAPYPIIWQANSAGVTALRWFSLNSQSSISIYTQAAFELTGTPTSVSPPEPFSMFIGNPIPDFPCPTGGPFCGGYSVSFGPTLSSLTPEVRIGVDIQLAGDVPDFIKPIWEAGIEDAWSRKFDLVLGGQDYPIVVDANFVDSNPNYIVNVFNTAGQYVGQPCSELETLGRSNALNWNVTPVKCGVFLGPPWVGIQDDPAMSGRLVAHEFGHLLGLYDEYVGGGIDPSVDPSLLCDINGSRTQPYCDGLMAMHWSGQVLESYFGRILSPAFGSVVLAPNPFAILPDPLPDPGYSTFELPLSQAPEPTTVALLLAACIGMGAARGVRYRLASNTRSRS